MRIVILSSSHEGGAGICALIVHEELIRKGYSSYFLSLRKSIHPIPSHFYYDKSNVWDWVYRFKDSFLHKLGLNKDYRVYYLENRPKGFEYFSFPFSDFRVDRNDLLREADIINLHWVSSFVDLNTFWKFVVKSNKKVVWTLHDMNPFTGGCHHADDCTGYKSSCHQCPQMTGTVDEDIAEKMLARKNKWLSDLKSDQLVIITPSQWLYNLSKNSVLFNRFDHHVITNGMETSIYKRLNKSELRKKWNLNNNEKIILFVAQDVANPRKGALLLQKALENPILQNQDPLILTIGKTDSFIAGKHRTINLGYISERNKIADLYNSADVFVLPSIAENFPNTICESLLCGTPVVAFAVGGIPEQLNDENGYLVKPFDVNDLAIGIDYVLMNRHKFDSNNIAENAAAKYSSQIAAEAYLDVYRQIS
jgi:glycosyltransferase involved in cell wall biosynthesis